MYSEYVIKTFFVILVNIENYKKIGKDMNRYLFTEREIP